MLSGCGIDLNEKEPEMIGFTLKQWHESSKEIIRQLRNGEIENPQEYMIASEVEGRELVVHFPYTPLIITRLYER